MQGKHFSEEIKMKIYKIRINDKLTYKKIAERFSININSIGPIVRSVQKKLEK